MSEYTIKEVLRRAEQINFDSLLEEFLLIYQLEEVRDNLLQAYFIIAEACSNDDYVTNTSVQTVLVLLRRLIEALRNTKKSEHSKFKIIAK